jgi:drug/metabolite transporter (DMT)-like permease
MTMWALGLVLASAVLHAAWNVCVKRHPDPNAGMSVMAASCCIWAAAIAAIEWALGWGAPFATARAGALALVCGASEAAYMLCLGRSLRDGAFGMSYVVVRGGAVLAVWPLAFALQGETPKPLQLAGIAAMLGGLAQLYPAGGGVTARAGYLWAMGGALFNATNHVAYKAAIGAGGRPWAVMAVGMLLATPVTVLMMGTVAATGADATAREERIRARLRAAFAAGPWLLIGAGVMSAWSFGLALAAMTSAGAAWVGTMRNASVALAPLLGWALLGERPTARALAGVALVTAAVVMLAL